MEVSKRKINKFSFIGLLLGISLIVLGGLEHTLLNSRVIIVPILSVAVSLAGLIGSSKEDIGSRYCSILGILIGIIYIILTIGFKM